MPVILHMGPGIPLLPFEERVRRSRMEGCLVIVPTKRRIRHLTREIMRLSPGAVAPALPLYTLESFCRTMYAASAGVRPVVTGPARTLLFHRAIRSVPLRYFATRGGDPRVPRGTFDRLIDVITGLKESGVYDAALEEELAASGDEERPKLADVARIYTAYEGELEAMGTEDLEGVYRFLAHAPQNAFAQWFRQLFPGVEALSIAGFDEFSVPEIRILRNVCHIPGLSLTLMFDYLRGNRELFGHLEENYRLFTELGFHATAGEKEAEAAAFFFGFSRRPPEAQRAADNLARTLFSRLPPPEKADLSSVLTVIAARSRVQEVELICKLIKRLVAARPERDLSAICVALRTPGIYTDIMREQFAKYEIAVNITDRFELARSPLVTAILGLLQIPLLGYRREDILRVVGSPYIRLPVDGDPFDAGNLAVVAARVRATAGVQAWFAKIDRAIAQTERLRDDTGDRGEALRLAEDLRGLRKSRSDFGILEEILRPFGRELTALEFEERSLSLMERVGVLAALIDPRLRLTPDLMEKDIRAFNAFRDTLRAVTSMAQLQDAPGERHPLRVHLERLRIAISQERYNVLEQFGKGVLVTSIEETRELPVDVMIVAGLVDGEFPSVYQPEIFLSERRRAERERRHTWESRYLYYQAVTNWTEHCYLTYPLRDGENLLVRSSFVDALLKTAQATLWEEDVPLAEDISSPEEFLSRYGGSEASPHAVPSRLGDDTARVRRAAAVERSRSIDHSLPEYAGLIGSALGEDGREFLHSFRSRVLSVSQLETYAACPFKFFAQVVLRLRELEEFEEEFTPLERGAVLHAILYEFYARRRAGSAPPLRSLPQEEFEIAVGDLIAIGREKLASLDIPEVFWEIERELITGRRNSDDGLLRRFLECERTRDDSLEPGFFEVSFGGTPGARGSSDPLLSREEPVRLGGVSLRGKIDRMDVGDSFFTVIDYKTGQDPPGLEAMREGMSLQLPVYLHAAEELLSGTGRIGCVPAGGLYYRLRDEVRLQPGVIANDFRGKAFPAGSKSKQVVADQRELRGVVEGTARAVERIVGGITGGEFPLTRPELVREVCGYCGFRTMCRIQAMKHVSPEAREDA